MSVGAYLLHLLYGMPVRPQALGPLLVGLVAFSLLRFVAPGRKWASFREGVLWSTFLTAFASVMVILLSLPRLLSMAELLVLVLAVPFVVFGAVYSWQHRRR